MKNSILAAIFGVAALIVPATASTGNFDFTTGTGNSNLSSYGPITGTVGGVTATAVAFYATSANTGGAPTSHLIGPVTSAGLTNSAAPQIGEYTQNGLGVCENQSTIDCGTPNHQVNNGSDTSATVQTASAVQNYEFILFKFSTAINLSQLQLGNFGNAGTTTNPFGATYWTSNSTSNLLTVEEALAGTTVAGVAGTSSFSSQTQTSCSTAQASLNPSGNNTNGAGSTFSDSCGLNGNGIDNLSGTGVYYLLVGASVTQPGLDAFKVQDLSYTVTATPEPATFGLIGLSLAALAFARKRKLV